VIHKGNVNMHAELQISRLTGPHTGFNGEIVYGITYFPEKVLANNFLPVAGFVCLTAYKKTCSL